MILTDLCLGDRVEEVSGRHSRLLAGAESASVQV